MLQKRLSILEKVRKFNSDLRKVGGHKAVNAFHHDYKNTGLGPAVDPDDIRKQGKIYPTIVERMMFFEKNNMQYKNYHSSQILTYGFVWRRTIGGRDYWSPIYDKLILLQRKEELIT